MVDDRLWTRQHNKCVSSGQRTIFRPKTRNRFTKIHKGAAKPESWIASWIACQKTLRNMPDFPYLPAAFPRGKRRLIGHTVLSGDGHPLRHDPIRTHQGRHTLTPSAAASHPRSPTTTQDPDSPRRSSGHRYHWVTTGVVYGRIGSSYFLARPKSQIASLPCERATNKKLPKTEQRKMWSERNGQQRAAARGEGTVESGKRASASTTR